MTKRNFSQDLVLLKSSDTRSKFRHSLKDVIGAEFGIGRGQRKLCLMLIQFLTDFWDSDKYPDIPVVYVGAAPGRSFRLITRMFPSLIFHLYDPANFDVEASERIVIHKKLFEEKDALEWKGKNILFLSDIRTPSKLEGNITKDLEKIVIRDMELQASWVKTIQPIAASLKFRPPYPVVDTPREFEYFKGWVCLQAWAPDRSSETRLVCTPPYETTRWDVIKYDLQIAFHNDIVRTKYTYQNLLEGKGNYDQKDVALSSLGYDSSLEVFILMRYFKKMGWPIDATRINNLRTLITQLLGERTVAEAGLKIQPNTHIIGTKPKHTKDLTFMFSQTRKALERDGPVTTILDGTAHVGSESLLMANIFKDTLTKLIAMEIDSGTYDSLVENIKPNKDDSADAVKIKSKIWPVQNDVVKYLRDPDRKSFDIIVFDPLFNNMKKDASGEMELYLGDVGIMELATELFQQEQARAIFVHAPREYQKLKPEQRLPGNVGRVAKIVWNISNDFNVFVLLRNVSVPRFSSNRRR
jgi:hypothetical protein